MRVSSAALAAALILWPCAVAAQAEDLARTWTVSGSAGVVSDYRDRGISLSGGEAVLQGEAALAHASGVYLYAWASGIEEYGVGADGDGAEIETALALGWAGPALGLDWDLGLAVNHYPDGEEVDYYEFPIQAGRTSGAWTWAVGAYYAPPQANLEDQDDAYVWTAVEYAPETWPVGLTAGLGYEDGYFAPEGVRTWSLGLSLPLGSFVADLRWTGGEAEDDALTAGLFVIF